MVREARPGATSRASEFSCVRAYARVSGREQGQHGTSLDAQDERFRAYCRQGNLPEPIVYAEIESAGEDKIERRVKLHALIADAKAGELILSIKVDRWSRDIVYGVDSVRKLLRRDIAWRAIDDGIDASTSAGLDQLNWMAAAADNERRRIRERTVGARDRLRDRGEFCAASVPLGYERNGRKLIPSKHAPVIKELHKRIINASLSNVCKAMRIAHPIRAWDKQSTHEILQSRVYLGELKDTRSNWIKGCHDPIIDLATWQRTQDALASRRNSGRAPGEEAKTKDWLLRGIASCSLCGHRMGASYGNGRSYYVCSNKVHSGGCAGGGYCPVAAVDAEASALLLARLIDLRQELAKPARIVPIIRDRTAERADIDRRRARLIEAIEEGTLRREDARRRLDELRDREERLGREEAAERARGEGAGVPSRADGSDSRYRGSVWGDDGRGPKEGPGAPGEADRASTRGDEDYVEERGGDAGLVASHASAEMSAARSRSVPIKRTCCASSWLLYMFAFDSEYSAAVHRPRRKARSGAIASGPRFM